MSVLDRFAQPLDHQQRAAGRELYDSGRVRIRTAGPGFLAALVNAPEGRQQTSLTWSGGSALGFYCTCELGQQHGVCAHVVATALAADAQGKLAPHTPRETRPRRGDDRGMMWLSATGQLRRAGADEPRPVPQHQPSPSSWKRQLATVREAAGLPERSDAWPADRQVIYIVDLQPSIEANSLVIRLAVRDRRQSGQWSRPKVRGVTFPDPAAFPDPDDRHILAMLRGASGNIHHAYDPAYPIPASLRASIVQTICRTGRATLRADPDGDAQPLAWDTAGPFRLTLEARRDESTQHYLFAGYLVRGEQRIPVSRPLLILAGGVALFPGEAAAVEDHGELAWIPILRQQRHLVVPFAQIDDLLGELLDIPNLPALDLPEELRIAQVHVAPRPILRVRAPGSAEHRPERLRAELRFDYAGTRVSAGGVHSRTVFQTQPRRLIIRDESAERDAQMRLARLGVRESPERGAGGREFWFNQRYLPRLVRTLVNDGWLVEADGKLYRRPGAMNLRVSSGTDWFDLSGEIDFEGHALQLPDLLKALNRGEKTVQLDDGTLGVLPEEWLRKYGLIASIGQDQSDEGFFRFARSQAALLDALVSSNQNVSFDPTFARVRQQLHSFAGVRPQDPPASFVGELRPYQRDGLGWFDFLRQFGFGGCLADDMGLGKTVQVLALLEQRRLLRAAKTANPSLVVVPKSLVFNWIAEAHRFTPALRILDHTGIERARHGQPLMDYDVVITTYGTLRRDVEFLKDIPFDYVVLDEAQAIKNPASESAKAVRTIRGAHRLALSGTPVQNHLGDLWSVFEFLNPGMLGSVSLFGDSQSTLRNPDPDARAVLARALRPFILRRTKEQVAGDLPARLEQTIYCELDESQRRLYDELRDYYRVSLLQRIDREGIARSRMHILEALLRLRQAAIHPGLIDESRIAEPSAKLDVLLPQLDEVIDEGHKALVFSQFTSMLAILRDRLDRQNITYEYLDGKTRDRATRVNRFQSDAGCRLFLISLKAGGLGLNLTAADYVFLLDPWWNPAIESQAIDRTHRIGQTRQVYACRLIARDTVEEKVVALQQSKRQLADAIITADNSLIRGLGREELEMLLG